MKKLLAYLFPPATPARKSIDEVLAAFTVPINDLYELATQHRGVIQDNHEEIADHKSAIDALNNHNEQLATHAAKAETIAMRLAALLA